MEVWKGLNKENYCMNELFQSNYGNTRSAGLNKLKTVFKSKIRENSFAYLSVQLWNSAPADITTETSESRVRKAISKICKNPSNVIDWSEDEVFFLTTSAI